MNSIGPSSSRPEVSNQDSELRQGIVEELIAKETVDISIFISFIYLYHQHSSSAFELLYY